MHSLHTQQDTLQQLLQGILPLVTAGYAVIRAELNRRALLRLVRLCTYPDCIGKNRPFEIQKGSG